MTMMMMMMMMRRRRRRMRMRMRASPLCIISEGYNDIPFFHTHNS